MYKSHQWLFVTDSSLICDIVTKYSIAAMEMYGLDDLEEHLTFCPQCNLPLYQKDDHIKFMLFSCRSCGYEVQQDYFYSLENKKINGIPVLPPIKSQKRGACIPTSLLTIHEIALRTQKAEMKEEFHCELSVDHLLEQYKEKKGCGYLEDNSCDKDQRRKLTCTEIMLEDGVSCSHDDEAFCSQYPNSKTKGTENYKIEEVCHLKNLSFNDIAGFVLKGHALNIRIPITKQFAQLKTGDMYIADKKMVKAVNYCEIWHSVVIVRFGRREGVNYFRFMNSHGPDFCDKGFADVRAADITEAFLLKI
uniref:Peptidase C1A papain C-terminal domain-containing protein n=1 Tax=Leersia perrieri TaxID=77586 RepID=A0A0D9VN99_9ORYZ